MAAQSQKKVAVLVDSATGWGRRLIQGILQYARTHGPWQVWIEPRGQREHLRTPPGWTGHGIIARVATRAMANELQQAGVPVVNVSGLKLAGPHFPTVTADPEASTRLAADHFLSRGFHYFAYYVPSRFPAAEEHYQSYSAKLAERGKTCTFYSPARTLTGFESKQADLARWLRDLPKPCAVLCWGLTGLSVLDACRSAAIDVPGDIAVLSGDYDDLLCEAATPPLSGIEVPSEHIGQTAAVMLDRLMSGQALPRELELVPPAHVMERQSTDVLAVDDPDVIAALRYIRDHVAEPFDVNAILAEVPCSRRSLERKFMDLLGRTPASEIRRAHLERAKQLLVETDLPIPEVAQASGFGSGEYMSQAFKAAVGSTPLKYRSRMRGRST